MDLAIKFADTSLLLSTTFDTDSKGVVGRLFGIHYRLDTRTTTFRSGFLADSNTAWDHMYTNVSKLRIGDKAKIPMYIPAKDGLQEYHLNAGEHVVLGATASGKTTTLFEGIKPFLDKVPSSANQVLVFGEDYIKDALDLSQPVELFVELANHILRQLASFYTFEGAVIDLDDDDMVEALLKQYSEDEFNEKFKLNVTPLPRILYLESIRDFVYSTGVLGKGGFNMRIAIESTHLRKAIEKLNIHLFVTINPLLDIEKKRELKKLASDFDSSVTSVILQIPSNERESEPEVRIYARGPANVDRKIRRTVMRNLIDNPVTDEEVLNKVSTSVPLEVTTPTLPEDEEWTDSTFVSSASHNNRKAISLFSDNLRKETSVTSDHDDFLDMFSNLGDK
jgi:hypothetical protein